MKKIASICVLSMILFSCGQGQKKSTQAVYEDDKPIAEQPAESAAPAEPTGLNIGDIAPPISLPDPTGKVIPLSSLRGKFVLIDFWASWCGPCRGENPNNVKIYNKYKDKGFEIYGVSLDRNKDAWEGAISADGLKWTHVSDLGFWNSSVVPEYGIQSIPSTVLLDKDGKIVAKDLRGEGLADKLKEVFGF